MTGRRVLITGASSGLGAALARHYAGPGAVLGLVARRGERLDEARTGLAAAGARVLTWAADVRDARQMAEIVREFWREADGADLVIANAGISLSDRLNAGDPGPATEVFAANVTGTLNTLLPVIPLMIERGRGHLAGIGSVAGFRGLPGKGAYSASKAALKTLFDAWRPVLRPSGIHVTMICPGYIRTELTAENPYPMPFLMDADRAAGLIARAIDRRAATYILPWQMRLLVPILQVVPDWMLPSRSGRK
jgi:short-subunit dehydrogenase